MKKSLDTYDKIPEGMRDYLSFYGFHFSKAACEFAVRQLKKELGSVESYTKEQVDELLKSYGVEIKNDTLYDVTYKYIKERAVHFGKSITNEQYLAMHIKEDLDEAGATGEETFREWYACMVGSGEPVEFEDLM